MFRVAGGRQFLISTMKTLRQTFSRFDAFKEALQSLRLVEMSPLMRREQKYRLLEAKIDLDTQWVNHLEDIETGERCLNSTLLV